MGLYSDQGALETIIPAIKEMYINYLEFLKLDGKPEKGERKMADDIILVINQLLLPYCCKYCRMSTKNN